MFLHLVGAQLLQLLIWHRFNQGNIRLNRIRCGINAHPLKNVFKIRQ